MTDFSPGQDFPPIVSWHKDAEKKEMTESKSGKPRYILPDGEYHTFFFAWTDFAENVDNNGRPQYRTTVRVDDKSLTIFAHKNLYKALMEYGLKENMTVQIKRTMVPFGAKGYSYQSFDVIPPESGEVPKPTTSEEAEGSADRAIEAIYVKEDDALGGDL